MGFPNNIADAASAIQDGSFGFLDTIEIGDLLVSVLTGLNAPKEYTITRKPIEDGYSITDAAVEEPTELVMTICLTNPEYSIEAGLSAALTGNAGSLLETWRDKRDKLYEIQSNRELVTVQTHDNTYDNMLIRLIDPIYDVDENSEAFFATVYLSEIRKVGTLLGGLIDAAEELVGGL